MEKKKARDEEGDNGTVGGRCGGRKGGRVKRTEGSRVGR